MWQKEKCPHIAHGMIVVKCEIQFIYKMTLYVFASTSGHCNKYELFHTLSAVQQLQCKGQQLCVHELTVLTGYEIGLQSEDSRALN